VYSANPESLFEEASVGANPRQKIPSSDEQFDGFFAFYRKWKANSQTNKKGTTMNLLTQSNKIRILPLLTAPALIALATFTPVSARATASCGVVTSNLLYPGQPVDTAHAAHFPDGLLNLLCNELQQYGWGIRTKVKGDSDVYIVQNTFPPGADTPGGTRIQGPA